MAQHYKDDMEKQLLMECCNEVDNSRRNPEKKKQKVDGKVVYKMPDPSDGFIDALEVVDEDSFPGIRKLLLCTYRS